MATSESPFGTVAGVQLAAVFQSPVAGFDCQVALPASAMPTLLQMMATSPANPTRDNFPNWECIRPQILMKIDHGREPAKVTRLLLLEAETPRGERLTIALQYVNNARSACER